MLNVLEIHRMSIHNGPGIRTMVHFKGCPLKCKWCSTPESQMAASQLGWHPEKCVGCGRCIQVCEKGAIRFGAAGQAEVDFSKCDNCLKCTQVCNSNVMRRIGNPLSGKKLFAEICKDKLFFETSGGGVVFSGGEPMMQVNEEFIELLKDLQKEGISIGIDTSGYAPQESYEKILPYVDFFLWDVKQTNDEKHRQITGVSNQRILSNLMYVDRMGKDIYLRCPTIPGFTDDQENLQQICTIAKSLKHLVEIHLIAFHHMGTARYQSIGWEDPTEDIALIPDEVIEEKRNTVALQGLPVKVIY